jgi:transposase-like protein|tara:strand:+ start:265 stop:510 length:246 start_codon:yes stop_codon:yes gene_type:complete
MEYLTEKEVVEKIHITRNSLHAQRKKGTGIPYTKIKGRIRYRAADLEKYGNSFHAYKLAVLKKKYPDYIEPPNNWRKKWEK